MTYLEESFIVAKGGKMNRGRFCVHFFNISISRIFSCRNNSQFISIMYKKSVIVERADYDKDGYTVYAKLGNVTETEYAYDDVRQRL